MAIESRQNNHNLKLLGTVEHLLSCEFLMVGPTFWHFIRNDAIAKKGKKAENQLEM